MGYREEEVLRAVVADDTALVLSSRDEGFGLPLATATVLAYQLALHGP